MVFLSLIFMLNPTMNLINRSHAPKCERKKISFSVFRIYLSVTCHTYKATHYNNSYSIIRWEPVIVGSSYIF